MMQTILRNDRLHHNEVDETPALANVTWICSGDDIAAPRLPQHERYGAGPAPCHPPCGCTATFQRAIDRNDDDAWAALYQRYGRMVRRWVQARPDDDDELVVQTFERFWRSVDREKLTRFGTLASVLCYLKLCAHSVRIDNARVASRTVPVCLLDDAASVAITDNVAEIVAMRLDGDGVWSRLAHLLDENERLVLYLSYGANLKPRDIHMRYGAYFSSVAMVYRIKRNALDRLRRSPSLYAALHQTP